MTTTRSSHHDLVVVGAGVVGLAHAVDAVKRGLSVAVVDRDDHAVGASVRNFGHVCTTAQSGPALDLALQARESWLDLGRKAGFDVLECGTVVVARHHDEAEVLGDLAALRGPDQVRMLTPHQWRDVVPVATDEVVAAAHLPLDLRVDPRTAIPAVAAWLAAEGATFHRSTSALGVDTGVVRTARGDVHGDRVVVAVGHDVDHLFPDVADQFAVQRCRLQMLEVDPPRPRRVEPAVLTGTSMLRYGAFAETTALAAVRDRITAETPELIDVGMNLMLTQRPDGRLVLGDTHHYATTHDPFDDERLAHLLLQEAERLLGTPLTVRTRWRGVYASSPHADFLIASPVPDVRVVAVTSGIGMTTALGLAPTVLSDLF